MAYTCSILLQLSLTMPVLPKLYKTIYGMTGIKSWDISI